MAHTIKTNISFDKYYSIINRVTEDCFVDGVYSPALYELSIRNALLSVFVPDFDMSDCKDNNDLWEKVTSDEACALLKEIYSTDCYDSLEEAIIDNINYRLTMIESSTMSLSDIALSKLFDVITNKIDSIDTDVMNKSTIESLVNATKQVNKEDFEKNLIDAMVESGVISKPNRATRRSNSKQKTDKKIKNIDTTKKENQ